MCIRDRYTGVGKDSGVNKTASASAGRSLISSKTICNLLSFDLPTILDTSLDEESLSPTEDAKETAVTSTASKLGAGRMSIGISREYKTVRQTYLDKRKNKLSVDLRRHDMRLNKPRRSLVKMGAREKLKVGGDENARRHLVRSHLNELYAKIVTLVRAKEKAKRHSVVILKTKHK
eukprot:TRINITY_DN5541_c0_g1_i5.p1 TRINITY_DN5541_c0_g1~~TRINITY_DN5541_c0_g1_i5.p1  ORF type:complete len:176 (+),score=32.26 TRINITY_DN5541_c0_g1_i5:73-600(+)